MKSDQHVNAPTGIALIGAGMIAQRHVTAISAMGARVSLRAIVSRSPERAHHLAHHYTGRSPLFTSDVQAVAQDPRVQIAIVATPPDARLELIEEFAIAGKHILLEKPVARNAQEAQHLVHICEKAQVTLGVLFQHRARDTSLKARQLLNSGALGKQGLIEIAVPLWREQSYYDEPGRGTYERDGGGVLMTQAIHTIDLALSLAGPISWVQAMTATTPLHQMESEDYAVAGLRFSSGAIGSLVASTATYPHGSETISIHCQHGSLLIGRESLEISWRDGRSETYPADSEMPTKQNTATPLFKWHQIVIEDFVDAVSLSQRPLVTGREALASHRLIEAIEASSRDAMAIEVS